MLHIYCGDGKGKTTAALGLALRAAGCGMKIHIVQLLKGSPTSELNSLALIPNITVARCERDFGFAFNMSEENKQQLAAVHNELLSAADKAAREGRADLLIIDEFNAAYELGLLDKAMAEHLVLSRPNNVELVLTGRNPAQLFVDAADYVSEIVPIKHPYDKGVTARKGIEF